MIDVRFASLAVALLAASPLPPPASSASPPPFADARADAAARAITQAQLLALSEAYSSLSLAHSIALDPLPPANGAARRAPVYEGKRADGKYHVAVDGDALACPHFLPHTEVEEADCYGALLSIAADSGRAGPALQGAFDGAADKHEFARAVGRAWQLENQHDEARADAVIAFMQSLPVGEKRAAVYDRLRRRGIVVSNPLFAPATAYGVKGCDDPSMLRAGDYPTFGEALPSPGPCGSNVASGEAGRTSLAPRSPSATATLDSGFDLTFAYRRAVELDFDDDDRLESVMVGPEQRLCICPPT